VGEAWRQLWDYLGSDAAWEGRNSLPTLLWAHVQLSLASLVVAAVLALPPAAWLGHTRRGAVVAVSLVNLGRAVPSFGVVALVFPFALRWGFGLGFWPTLVALVLLALPPIFTNTYTGVRDVPPDAVDAARGMGMRPADLLRKVEVPVALPLILTGLRVSAVQVVATATLGALVGYRCLGTPSVAGFQRADKGPLVAAAITVALLALLADAVFALLQRLLVPWRAPPGRRADATVAPRLPAPPGRAPWPVPVPPREREPGPGQGAQAQAQRSRATRTP
jgi:osmoprotectant transport system permease protein